MLSPIHVRHFWNFWENILHRNWVLSQLAVWIFISELFIDISSNSAYFPRLITLELPKLPNSNYLKLTIKDSTVLWSPLYLYIVDDQIQWTNFDRLEGLHCRHVMFFDQGIRSLFHFLESWPNFLWDCCLWWPTLIENRDSLYW